MTQLLNVWGLPSIVQPEEFVGGTVVVIDVLRASTTIVHALAAGAAEIAPCQEVDEARRVASNIPPDRVVLGGERNAVEIEGFDLGNSPDDYTADRVAGKTVVFTTTNGTRAMARCKQADRVLIGAFVNAQAVCWQLLGVDRVHLLCAGTKGDYSRDDILAAGMLVHRLERLGAANYKMNVQALTARENWTSSFSIPHASGAELLPPERLAAELAKSPAGRRLTAIGGQADILAASRIDQFDVVPELDLGTFRVRKV